MVIIENYTFGKNILKKNISTVNRINFQQKSYSKKDIFIQTMHNSSQVVLKL